MAKKNEASESATSTRSKPRASAQVKKGAKGAKAPRKRTRRAAPAPRAAKAMAARQAAFLAAYEKAGTISAACDASNVCRRSVYDWLENPDFKARAELARKMATDTMEQEARRRAVDGWDEPVYHVVDGEVVTSVRRKYSDTLLIFLLKANDPDKFKDRIDHTSDDMPIKVYAGFDPDAV